MKILGLGVPELVIILVVVLLIFGPKNLPKLGASLGKTVKSLREGMAFDKKDDEEVEEIIEIVEDEPRSPTPLPASQRPRWSRRSFARRPSNIREPSLRPRVRGSFQPSLPREAAAARYGQRRFSSFYQMRFISSDVPVGESRFVSLR